jgi:hypothetical protein
MRGERPSVRIWRQIVLPMLIEPIVASGGTGGRLGNYADPTAADTRFSLGSDPDREHDSTVPTRFPAASAAVHLAWLAT